MEKGNGNGSGPEGGPEGGGVSLLVRDKTTKPKPLRHELVKSMSKQGFLSFAASKMLGGKRCFYDLARQALKNHPDIKPFLDHLDKQTPYHLYHTPLEKLVDDSGVERRLILEAVVGIAAELDYDISHLIASQQLPSVVEHSIKFAKKTRGFRDRQLLMQHAGFVPVPSGSVININQRINGQSQRDAGMDSFEDTMKRLQETTVEAEIVNTVETMGEDVLSEDNDE